MSVFTATGDDGLTRDGSYLDPAQSWTVCRWVRVDTAPVVQVDLWLLDASGAFAVPWIWQGLNPAGLGGVMVGGAFDAGSGEVDTDTHAVNVGEWFHAALVYDADVLTLALYVNAVLIGTPPDCDLSLIAPQTSELLIARSVSDGDVAMACDRRFQSALTSTQLLAEMRQSRAVATALSDTPIQAPDDLTDLAAGAHDWTAIDTPTLDDAPAIAGAVGSTAIGIGSTITVDVTALPSDVLVRPAARPLVNGQHAVWRTFTAPSGVSVPIQIDTIGSGYDTVLSVWANSGGQLVEVFSNDDADELGEQSLIHFGTVPSQVYYIIAAYGAADTSLILHLNVSRTSTITLDSQTLLTLGTYSGNYYGTPTNEPALIAFNTSGTRLAQFIEAPVRSNAQLTFRTDGAMGPNGWMAAGYSGDIYVTGNPDHPVAYRFNADLGMLNVFDIAENTVDDELPCAIDADGRLLVGYGSPHLTPEDCYIRRWNPDGTLDDAWVVSAALSGAVIALVAAGDIVYFVSHDETNAAMKRRVRRLDTSSGMLLSDLVADLGNPSDRNLVVMPISGDVLAGVNLGSSDSQVLRYTSAGASVQTYGPFGDAHQSGTMAVSPDDATFYVALNDEHIHGYRTSDGVEVVDFASTTTACLALRMQSLELGSCPTPTAVVGVAYASGLTATGGVPPYTFSLDAGTLPTGVVLDATTGAITGTPTTSGTYSFAPLVTDNEDNTADSSCQIVVSPGTTFPICRKRRFPLPFEQNKLITIYRIEFLIQSGVSPNAELTARFSRDGGNNFVISRTLTAGATDAFGYRVYTTNLGQGRNWVCELSTSEPYFWALIGCYADIEMGTS